MSLTTPSSVQKLQTALHAKAKESPNLRFHALYDKVYRKDVLAYAYDHCRANGGAAGVDSQTFENIADTLAAAGCTWADVEEITAYHVGLHAQGDLVLEVAVQFMSKPFPAWSAIGVTELFEPDAIVELRVVATIPGG